MDILKLEEIFMTLKNKLLIILSNLVVIAIVLGLNLAFTNFDNNIRIATFVCLIITLAIPSFAIIVFKTFDSPESLITVVAMVANLIATIIMFSNNISDPKPLIITESVIGGLYVVLLMLSFALKSSNK